MGAAAARLMWLTRPLRHLSPVIGKLRSHREYARELLRPPTHPRGFALQSVQYQSLGLVERIVSPETVTDRQRERFRYVRDRVPSTSFPADFDTHIEVGQWVEYFCENTVDTTRQVAQARGVSMSTPYAGKAVAETALSIPTPERFLDRLSEKHVPKKLLARRLLDYRTGKPKGNGHLPEGRYFREGPLADVFEKYPMPEFVPDGLRADLPDEHPGLAWILASYAIWRDRVLTEPVDPVPATRTVEG
nr:asparagine synthase-related protein [Halorientalis litorea]